MRKYPCYPAFYDKMRIGKDKVNCITATIDNYYDGHGTRPFILEVEDAPYSHDEASRTCDTDGKHEA